jgi:hypothetical protein
VTWTRGGPSFKPKTAPPPGGWKLRSPIGRGGAQVTGGAFRPHTTPEKWFFGVAQDGDGDGHREGEEKISKEVANHGKAGKEADVEDRADETS